jgi:nuclear pore complex protein Nup107
MRTMKRELREELVKVEAAVFPCLQQNFLIEAFDEKELDMLQTIRNHYLPEIVLGFNSVLFFAGYAISRTHLAESMNLANIVAETPGLTQAFVASGRMKDLVQALAMNSRSLLKANEQGDGKTKRKTGKEKTKGLHLWNVEWIDSGDATGMEALD